MPNQKAEKALFEGLKAELNGFPNTIMRDVHNFMWKTGQILSNSSMGIV